MTSKRKRGRQDRGTEPVRILIQRVEFDKNGQPVLVYDSVKINVPTTGNTTKGNQYD